MPSGVGARIGSNTCCACRSAVSHVAGMYCVDLLAEMFVRICALYLTIPTDLVDLTDDDALRGIARQFLVPMLEYRPTPESATRPADPLLQEG